MFWKAEQSVVFTINCHMFLKQSSAVHAGSGGRSKCGNTTVLNIPLKPKSTEFKVLLKYYQLNLLKASKVKVRNMQNGTFNSLML